MESDCVVRRLKEILHDRSEQEIYDALKECRMDPGEAVERLLSQDTFHEVKSKRERRKEKREMQILKSSNASSLFNEDWSSDHEEGITIVQSNSNAPDAAPSERENFPGISSASYLSSALQTAGRTSDQQSMHDSAETRGETTGTGSTATSSSERTLAADIVTRGSICDGSLEFTDMSLNYEDTPQASDGHSGWENVSSLECSSAPTGLPMAMDDVAAACQGDDSSEQMPLDDENSCKKGSQEVVSDVQGVNDLGELLPKQTSEDAGKVVLPNHVQALAARCPNLIFGTYNSESSSTTTGLHLSDSLKIDLERFSTSSSNQPLYTEQLPTGMREPLSALSIRQQPLGAASGKGQIPIASDLVSQGSQSPSCGQIWEPGYASSYWKEEVPQYSRKMTLTPLPSFEPSSQASYGRHRLPNRLLHPNYSQQTDLHKEYADLNSYPNVSPKYGQIPLHQSPASTKHGLPMYKRDVLPRNLAISSYDSNRSGGTRSLNTIPGGFLGNSAATSNLPAVAYNMLHNQIPKDANHFQPHGLSDDRSNGWDYKAGPGATSNALVNMYYNSLQEQERNLVHQQDRQYSPDYGSLGNSSSYHSQVGARPDNQLLQSFKDMTLNNRTDALSKQNQFWQQKGR